MIAARGRGALAQEIARAKERFGLPAGDAGGDDAGGELLRGGPRGVLATPLSGGAGVADSASIEVNRRKRRAAWMWASRSTSCSVPGRGAEGVERGAGADGGGGGIGGSCTGSC
jgi:hypothetical protein